MNKEKVFSIIRSVLTIVGAFLVGKSFLGNTIDDNLWLGIGGGIITAISVVWGIVDKTATIEGLQSGIRNVLIFFGALLVGSGIIKDEVLQAILGIVPIVITILYSQLSKAKSKEIAEGKLGVADLSGVKSAEVIAPVVKTPTDNNQ